MQSDFMSRVFAAVELRNPRLGEVCTQGHKLLPTFIHIGLSGTRVTWKAWKEGHATTERPFTAFEMVMKDHSDQFDVERAFREHRRGSLTACRR